MFYEGRRAGAPEAATKARPKARRPDGPARPELRLDEAGAPIGRSRSSDWTKPELRLDEDMEWEVWRRGRPERLVGVLLRRLEDGRLVVRTAAGTVVLNRPEFYRVVHHATHTHPHSLIKRPT